MVQSTLFCIPLLIIAIYESRVDARQVREIRRAALEGVPADRTAARDGRGPETVEDPDVHEEGENEGMILSRVKFADLVKKLPNLEVRRLCLCVVAVFLVQMLTALSSVAALLRITEERTGREGAGQERGAGFGLARAHSRRTQVAPSGNRTNQARGRDSVGGRESGGGWTVVWPRLANSALMQCVEQVELREASGGVVSLQ